MANGRLKSIAEPRYCCTYCNLCQTDIIFSIPPHEHWGIVVNELSVDVSSGDGKLKV
jgi:hypothetical protein